MHTAQSLQSAVSAQSKNCDVSDCLIIDSQRRVVATERKGEGTGVHTDDEVLTSCNSTTQAACRRRLMVRPHCRLIVELETFES